MAELVLFIKNFTELEEKYESKYKRIYFGEEFCERKLVNVKKDLKTVMNFTKQKNIPITIVTPPVTRHGLDIISGIFKLLTDNTEIVFNDWGVFNTLKSFDKLIPVMGRLLVTIKRDHRIKENFKDFKLSNLDSVIFQNFLIKNNIFRVEVDNVRQGYGFKLDSKIKLSVYTPFVYTTLSRRCFFNIDDSGPLNILECNFSCDGLELSAAIDNEDVIIRSNAQFYLNDKLDLDGNSAYKKDLRIIRDI